MEIKIKSAAYASLLLLSLFGFSAVHAQFGIGASGGILYPGLIGSDETGSQFRTGWGYEFFIQHQLFRLSDSLLVDARYAYRQYKNPVELPFILDTWFTFQFLTVNLLMDFFRSNHFAFFTGAGGSLVISTANKDFFSNTSTLFLPEIYLGLKWIPTKDYTVFTELSMQFGTLPDIFQENIPVSGFRFVIGTIMFLSTIEPEK